MSCPCPGAAPIEQPCAQMVGFRIRRYPYGLWRRWVGPNGRPIDRGYPRCSRRWSRSELSGRRSREKSHMGALQKKAIGAGLALVLTVSAIALVPTTASAQTRDLTGEQIDELESWCRAKGGTVTKRITGSGSSSTAFCRTAHGLRAGLFGVRARGAASGSSRARHRPPPTTSPSPVARPVHRPRATCRKLRPLR